MIRKAYSEPLELLREVASQRMSYAFDMGNAGAGMRTGCFHLL